MESNTKDRELLITRTLNAPVELVWEAFTNPEHVANWWGPNGFTNTIYTMDLKPGGLWELVMHGPDGTNYKNKSVYKEIVVNKRIVFNHFNPDFTTTIEFEEQGEQTHLRWHMLFESVEEFIQVVKTFKADEGLKQNIEKLIVYLQGMGTPNAS
ncbi:MAG TPA: SRPBCC family protein [Mucilaginibacter sp.]|nr:SRPBCC family protein [Mucilaginibacter sp.]